EKRGGGPNDVHGRTQANLDFVAGLLSIGEETRVLARLRRGGHVPGGSNGEAGTEEQQDPRAAAEGEPALSERVADRRHAPTFRARNRPANSAVRGRSRALRALRRLGHLVYRRQRLASVGPRLHTATVGWAIHTFIAST